MKAFVAVAVAFVPLALCLTLVEGEEDVVGKEPNVNVTSATATPTGDEAEEEHRTKKIEFWCYACYGELSDNSKSFKESGIKSCKEMRAYIKATAKDKTKAKIKKYSAKKKAEWEALIEAGFIQQCFEGDEECYNLRANNKLILGFEERGCGSGPEALPAEPHENCAVGVLRKINEPLDMQNCACDEILCNGGPRGRGCPLALIILLSLGLLLLHLFM